MTAEQPTPPSGGTPPPPAATPPPPAATPPAAPATSGSGFSIGAGQVVAILGAVAVAVSVILNWIDISVGARSLSGNATEVPVQFLFDKNTSASDPSLIVLLLPAALLLVLGAVIRRGKIFGILGGLLAIVVPVLYGVQVQRGLDDDLSHLNLSLNDFIGIGVYVALVGGIVGLIGAIITRSKPTPGAPTPLA